LRKLDDTTTKWAARASDHAVDPWRAARQANRALHREMGRPWAACSMAPVKAPLADLRLGDRLAPLTFDVKPVHTARPPPMPASSHANPRAAALLRVQQEAHADPAGIRRRLLFDAATAPVSNAAGAA
jgi:hypothetical protein